MKGVDTAMQQKIVDLISAIIPHAKIILFGSRARKDNTDLSDIDIALDIGEKLPLNLFGEVRSILEATNIPYIIEVVDVHRVSKGMLESIKDEGVIWKN